MRGRTRSHLGAPPLPLSLPLLPPLGPPSPSCSLAHPRASFRQPCRLPFQQQQVRASCGAHSLRSPPLLSFPSPPRRRLPSPPSFSSLPCKTRFHFWRPPSGKDPKSAEKNTRQKHSWPRSRFFFPNFESKANIAGPKTHSKASPPREYLHCGMVSKANIILDGNITVETCEARVKALQPPEHTTRTASSPPRPLHERWHLLGASDQDEGRESAHLGERE